MLIYRAPYSNTNKGGLEAVTSTSLSMGTNASYKFIPHYSKHNFSLFLSLTHKRIRNIQKKIKKEKKKETARPLNKCHVQRQICPNRDTNPAHPIFTVVVTGYQSPHYVIPTGDVSNNAFCRRYCQLR